MEEEARRAAPPAAPIADARELLPKRTSWRGESRWLRLLRLQSISPMGHECATQLRHARHVLKTLLVPIAVRCSSLVRWPWGDMPWSHAVGGCPARYAGALPKITDA